MKRFAAALVLGLGMLLPAGVALAQDHPQHVWADTENPAWHQYLKARHRKYHDWSKASKREQEAYWKWRDQHPDAH